MAPEPTESHVRDPPAPAQPTTRIDTLLAPALEVQDTPSPSSNDIDILTPNDSPSSAPVPKLEIPNSTHEETARSPALSDSNGGTRPLPDIANARGLPVPAASVNHGNPSQSSFVFPDAGSTVGTRDAGGLAPEIARADVSISSDGSFVQTTSALAARELKKCYDQILGVGQGAQGLVRSPYVITAVQDAGRQVFRIGHRAQHESTSVETPSPQPSSPYSPGHAVGPRRKARRSVHDFLPSSMFKPNASGSTPPRNASFVALGPGSTPPTNGSSSTSTPHVPRKLRKTRSNSDLYLRGTSSPPQAGSSTSGDNSGHLSPPPRAESFSIEIRDEVTAGADAFSQVLGWSSELATESAASSRKNPKSSLSPSQEGSGEQQENLTSALDTPLSRRPSVSTSAALSSTNGDTSNAPFGENVRYTAPMRRSAIFLASQPPQLREMQSFESGLTARVGDDREGMPGTPKSKPKATGKGEGEAFLAAKSQARFSTTVFDVLQTYRGLPLPSALSELSTGATIKLSTTDSANPKDDPRFVIWGEIQPEGTLLDDASLSQSSHTDLSASATSAVSGPGSRKRSNARPPHSSNDPPQLVKSEVTPHTVMIAATVERWIAQLTSELNYDELLNFLLTYRTYVSPVDLCHLLICRFHWALETPSSGQDDTVRRIVRVRTFIAIRYWILTFFREDFLPNPELCHLFATWLNALFRDPALNKHADAVNIVRKLKKIVRECKAAHSRHGRSGVGRPSMDSRPTPYSSLNGVLGDLAQSGTLDPSAKKPSTGKANADNDDSDVDLDFSPEANSHYAEDSTIEGTIDSPESSGHQSSHTQPIIAIPPVQGRSPATPSANSILLSQPLSMTILGHVKSTKPGTDTPLTQIPTSLPVQHSAISRAFVNTIGRLGRWKRVLNSRSSVPAPHCGDLSTFDLEPNATGDLLAVRGGVEEYLKMLNLSPPLLLAPSAPSAPEDTAVSGDEKLRPTRPPGLTPADEERVVLEKDKDKPSRPTSLQLEALKEEGEDAATEDTSRLRQRASRDSFFFSGSEVTDESGRLSSEISVPSGWAPEIVSLDDYDLSDSDSSSQSPARVRRLPRRLPLRRDFQFVRRSIDSVSSMGIRSHSSVASSVRSGSASESARSWSRRSSGSGGRPLVTANIENWQIELISDDEEEAGDAEAALRRLEGQIDTDRQREKDMKVGRWLKTASRRPDRDSTSSIHSGSQFSELDEDEEADAYVPDGEDVTVSVNSVRSSTIGVSSETDTGKSAGTIASEPPSTAATGLASASAPSKSATERDRSGSVGSQAPVTSRPGSRPSSSAGVARRPSLLGRASRAPAPSKFGSPNVPSAHRSFILMHRSETLAQQFAIIDAGLFAKVKFEELISHQWGQSPEDVNVKDWVQFVKERAKLKNTTKPGLDSVAPAKLSAILALRARFDLLVNFTSSEILLTHPSERVMVVAKFIRIAWKAYRHNNFNTLVSLIAGLQTRWVNQAMGRNWHKVGMWEQRVFDDLKKFTSRSGEFKYLRNATTALVDARPLQPGMQDGVTTTTTVSPVGTSSKARVSESRDAPSACVPFLGVYLAQLYEHERLPDFVDPTAPAEPVLIDGDTGTLSPPSHAEVFLNLQALPRDLALEPLINVHKQRLIASVIKSFVAGQHLATKIHFEVDQKSYQKCFRLRSLEPDALHSIAKGFSDS